MDVRNTRKQNVVSTGLTRFSFVLLVRLCTSGTFYDFLGTSWYVFSIDWARGWGPLGQGPGPLGPGPKLQDTHGECNYPLSGRLPTVRQTTNCQANYLLSKLEAVTHGDPLSGSLPTVRQAEGRCRRCTQKPHMLHPEVSAYMHPKSAYMHPRVSAYMHPNL